MITEKRKLGNDGEKIAVKYLRNNGYKILNQNFQWKQKVGEIDIIAQKNNTIIFVEVKTREKAFQNTCFPPEVNVNFTKQQKIIRTAQLYLLKNNLSETDWQIDVIAIEIDQRNQKAELRHFKNAVWQ